MEKSTWGRSRVYLVYLPASQQDSRNSLVTQVRPGLGTVGGTGYSARNSQSSSPATDFSTPIRLYTPMLYTWMFFVLVAYSALQMAVSWQLDVNWA